VVLLLVALAPLSARAQPREGQPRDPRESEAETECLAGRVPRGIELLAQLYVATGDANYIYNQGRCFEQNGRPEDAIPRFKEYLRKATNLTPADRADAETHIRDCEQMRDQARASVPTPVLTPPPPIVTAAPSRRPSRAAIPLLAVGATSLALALAAGAGVQAMESDVKEQWNESRHHWGQRFEVIQWSAYVVAAIGLIGGGALYFYPTTGGGGAVALRGSFR
jgi:hypothetical protein